MVLLKTEDAQIFCSCSYSGYSLDGIYILFNLPSKMVNLISCLDRLMVTDSYVVLVNLKNSLSSTILWNMMIHHQELFALILVQEKLKQHLNVTELKQLLLLFVKMSFQLHKRAILAMVLNHCLKDSVFQISTNFQKKLIWPNMTIW